MTFVLFITWLISLSDENNSTVLCVVLFFAMLVSAGQKCAA